MTTKNTKAIKFSKDTKSTKSTESTTIRIEKSTKEKIENLDFVKKHTYNKILLVLIEFYNKKSK